ncbi:MAG: hypothetical protein K0S24_1896 [Sphingobacterium sp.]|nr:hypothetical protein [Sphingobacterium sp.]
MLNEFRDKFEFNISVIDAIETRDGKIGLWLTIKQITRESLRCGHQYVLICEDDHEFTKGITEAKLFFAINHASRLNADVLFGGIVFLEGGSEFKEILFLSMILHVPNLL